jgi:hypothetical protein
MSTTSVSLCPEDEEPEGERKQVKYLESTIIFVLKDEPVISLEGLVGKLRERHAFLRLNSSLDTCPGHHVTQSYVSSDTRNEVNYIFVPVPTFVTENTIDREWEWRRKGNGMRKRVKRNGSRNEIREESCFLLFKKDLCLEVKAKKQRKESACVEIDTDRRDHEGKKMPGNSYQRQE